jgi:hypothetical protein
VTAEAPASDPDMPLPRYETPDTRFVYVLNIAIGDLISVPPEARDGFTTRATFRHSGSRPAILPAPHDARQRVVAAAVTWRVAETTVV